MPIPLWYAERLGFVPCPFCGREPFVYPSDYDRKLELRAEREELLRPKLPD